MEGHADQRCFISTRNELASPTTDWERTWRLARLKGLGPDNTTFLFRLGHKLLVTKERQSRTNPASSPICTALGWEMAVLRTWSMLSFSVRPTMVYAWL